jgi:hypothetical protein
MRKGSLPLLLLLLASLCSLAHSLTVTHEAYSVNQVWPFIKGRKMVLSKCFRVFAAVDLADIFTWQSRNNLHIQGPCGTADCAFTMSTSGSTINFSLGTCNGTLAAPCTAYISAIRQATRITLLTNLINFFNGSNPNPVFVLENVV